ncbi:sugar fermentation stimulation protein [Denitrovibrio acetiphilus DSM 12809]|uniref:Sugar fermentation stimulation protein homolog n=1 Tax=Denitrovibrio acetiphilus (strain DSM 12809 / NBRC 114555 / N2460) TaxID=522772 RepID=D4H7K6_DENA2|nr:DNA/RNA nuclease SfsA [Denitrovibrio acetiphilus]ADD68005.1 sugar fermentation stimulation protein [Denitrovibrio acetiphilus DSM 12809]
MYKYPKLLKAKFIKRYKRFFTDVETSGEILTVHNPNTGSMKCIVKEGRDVLISESDNPKRKLKHTLEAFLIDGEWILTNTILMNRIVKHGIQDGEIPELGVISYLKSEYKYGDGRIDFLVECELGKCLIEVKNVTMFDEDTCIFPDAVTERGKKHLGLLVKSIEEGYTPIMFYVCQIDKPYFRPAWEIDPAYSAALYDAVDKGVRVVTLHTVFDEEEGTVFLEKGGELIKRQQA